MKRKYYCLIAGLPDLLFDDFSGLPGSAGIREYLENQLHPEDFKLVQLLFLPSENTRLLNQTLSFSPPDQETESSDTPVHESHHGQPHSQYRYMDKFAEWQNKSGHEVSEKIRRNTLHQMFYTEMCAHPNAFISQWFCFELNLRNILTAINCRRFHADPEEELILIPQQVEATGLLLENRLNPVYFREYISYAEEIFRIGGSDKGMKEKEKALDQLRWDYACELTFFHYFTVERVLDFMIRLMITERWMAMDAVTGIKLLEKLAYELKRNYKFPEELHILNTGTWELREK